MEGEGTFRLVEVAWERDGHAQFGNVMVEYVVRGENDERWEEITGVYCPEETPVHWQDSCTEQAVLEFTADWRRI